ncbi:hypothetical protein ACKFKF_29670 [Phormidesmis sp. 146-12]
MDKKAPPPCKVLGLLFCLNFLNYTVITLQSKAQLRYLFLCPCPAAGGEAAEAGGGGNPAERYASNDN